MIRHEPSCVQPDEALSRAKPADPTAGLLPLTLARPLEPRLMLDAAAAATIDLIGEPVACCMPPEAGDDSLAHGGDGSVEWPGDDVSAELDGEVPLDDLAGADEGYELPFDDLVANEAPPDVGEPLASPPNPPVWLERPIEVGDEWLPDAVEHAVPLELSTGDEAIGGESGMIQASLGPVEMEAGPPNPPVFPATGVVAAGPRGTFDPPGLLTVGEVRPSGVGDGFRPVALVGNPTPPHDLGGVAPMPQQVSPPSLVLSAGGGSVAGEPDGAATGSVRPHEVVADWRPQPVPGSESAPLSFAGVTSMRDASPVMGWLKRALG